MSHIVNHNTYGSSILHTATQMPANSWVEIDTCALHHNLTLYKSVSQGALMAPVIKSNAYGHGIELVAGVCQESSAVDMVCVVSVSEALRIKAVGVTKPIVVLSIIDGDLGAAIEQDIQLVVYDLALAAHLNALGALLKKQVYVHVKIDTGLSRLGFLWYEALSAIKILRTYPWIRMQGIFSHFAESENTASNFTHIQQDRLKFVVEHCLNEGISFPLVHASCSAAATLYPTAGATMVRLGIGIYGLWPSAETKHATQLRYPHFDLRPVLMWKTRVIQIKTIPAGSCVGYDRTYCVTTDTCIAVLPVGYWDGYDRALSNKGLVLIGNKLAPIVGRVAMNLVMVDVTAIDTHVGDQVCLLGGHEALSADALAAKCDTIHYEMVSRINPLVPRVRR